MLRTHLFHKSFLLHDFHVIAIRCVCWSVVMRDSIYAIARIFYANSVVCALLNSATFDDLE